MTHELGPTRPDRLTIWPLDTGGFGIDGRWSGGEGNRRATVARRLLEDAGVRSRLAQHPDGRGWELRLGPVPAADVARLIEQFRLVAGPPIRPAGSSSGRSAA